LIPPLLDHRLESAKKRGELDFSHRALTYAIAQLRHWDGRRRNFITVLDAAEFLVCDRGSIQVRHAGPNGRSASTHATLDWVLTRQQPAAPNLTLPYQRLHSCLCWLLLANLV